MNPKYPTQSVPQLHCNCTYTQHYHGLQRCTVLSSWIACWPWVVSIHLSMPQYFLQTCLEPLKADQTKQSRQIVTKTEKAIFRLKRSSKMDFLVHSWAQVCSLFLVSFCIVGVFCFDLVFFIWQSFHPQSILKPSMWRCMQQLCKWAKFTVVDVFHPYSNLLTLY